MKKKYKDWLKTAKVIKTLGTDYEVVVNQKTNRAIILKNVNGELKYYATYESFEEEETNTSRRIKRNKKLVEKFKKKKTLEEKELAQIHKQEELEKYLTSFLNFFQHDKKGYLKGLANLSNLNKVSKLKQELNKAQNLSYRYIKYVLNLGDDLKKNRKQLNKLGIKTNISSLSGLGDLSFNLDRKNRKLNSDLKTLNKKIKFVEALKNDNANNFLKIIAKHPKTDNLQKYLHNKYGLKTDEVITLLASILSDKVK